MSVDVIKNGDAITAADNALKQSVLMTVMAVAAKAKTLAPVYEDKRTKKQVKKSINPRRTGGRLRNSIMWRVQYKKGGNVNGPGGDNPEIDVNPGKFEGYVGSAVDYSVYQEFGTRYMPAQPFLRPAIGFVYLSAFQSEIAAANIDAMRKAMGAGKKFGGK